MKNQTTRRELLGSAAAVLGATQAAGQELLRPSSKSSKAGRVLGANDRINIAYIGCGVRFRGLAADVARRIKASNDVEAVAVCDVYSKRRERATALTKAPDSTVDYREILARPDVDGVIVAVPDHLHYQIAADACLAGKDVYLEKPMTYTAEEAAELDALVKRTKRVMQIGVTGMFAGIYPAVRKYIDDGKLGKVSWAMTSYSRNSPKGEWNWDIEPEASAENIDWQRWLGPAPKRRFSRERYFRWRKYKDYSGGVATDLLYHRLSPLAYVLGEQFPSRVTASGGIYIQKDREVPDNLFLSVEYPGDYTILLISSMTNAANVPTRIHGQYGTLEFVGANGAKVIPERTFAKEFRERNEGAAEVTLTGEQRPDMISNWLDCMRTRNKTFLDSELGHKVMTAIKLGVDSYYRGEVMLYDPASGKRLKKAPARPMYQAGDAADTA